MRDVGRVWTLCGIEISVPFFVSAIDLPVYRRRAGFTERGPHIAYHVGRARVPLHLPLEADHRVVTKER